MTDPGQLEAPFAADLDRRGRWLRRLAVALLAGALSVGYSWTFFGRIDSTSGTRDWVFYQSSAEVVRRSVLEHRQLPQWDPWRCGGAPLLAHPALDVGSPWGLLQIGLGPSLALRLSVLLHLFVALVGAWWWARRRGLSAVGAAGTAIAFGLSGWFAATVSWGFAAALPAAYLPLLVIAYERSRQRLGAALAGGAVLALMVVEGGLAMAQLGLLLVLCLAIVDGCAGWRPALRSLASLALHAAAGVGLAAYKLVPAYLLVREWPLPPPKSDMLVLSQVVDMLLGRTSGHWVAGYTNERFQYFAYIGPLVMAAALWGLWQARRPPWDKLYAAVGLLMLVVLGQQGTWMPYHWLAKVEVLRWATLYPSRLVIAVGLLLALVFGLVLDRLQSRLRQRWPRWPWRALAGLVVAALAVDLGLVAHGHWRSQPFAADPIARQANPFHLVDGDRGAGYRNLRANQGTLRCFDPLPIAPARGLRTGVQPQVWLAEPEAGSVELEQFSPNRWQIRVALERAGVILVNQNFDRGWHALGERSAGAFDHEGQLAIEASAGEGVIALEYRTPGLVEGALAFAIALLAVLGAALATARRETPAASTVVPP
ncbi:MAG: hypothetical protein JXR83_10275 [Deltaproteobacteria bacterium]|nr:hypothetical protein [Deltaproteobacteria bacterium]